MALQANSLHGRIPSGDQAPLLRKYSIDELDRGLWCIIDRDGYVATDQDHTDYLDAEADMAWLQEEDTNAAAESEAEAA